MAYRRFISQSDLLDLIHDRWFDLDEIEYDERAKQLRVHLGDDSKGPFNQRTLVITEVQGIAIHDEANIGIYDLNTIRARLPHVEIISAFPLTIIATVQEGMGIQVVDQTATYTVAPDEVFGEEWRFGPWEAIRKAVEVVVKAIKRTRTGS